MKKESSIIRKAIQTDIEKIFEILKSGFPPYEYQYTIYSSLYYKKYLNKIIRNDQSHAIFVAQEEDKIVGFSHFRIIDNMLFLNNIYILKTSQGKNLGKKLLESGFKYFRNNSNIKYFALDVFADNVKAMNWYKKIGLKVISNTFWYVIKHSEIKNINIKHRYAIKPNINSSGFDNYELNIDNIIFNIGITDKRFVRVTDSSLLNSNSFLFFLEKEKLNAIFIISENIEGKAIFAKSYRMQTKFSNVYK